MLDGQRLRVEGESEQVSALILAAARGSIMELAWVTEVDTGQRIGINPDHVVLVRRIEL